MYFILRYKNCW